MGNGGPGARPSLRDGRRRLTLTAGVAQAGVVPDRPGLLSSVTAPCDFKTVSSCQSTDPAIRTYVVLSGSLNGCTFDFTVNWGDNSKPQRVIMTNPKDGTDFLAGHTFSYSNADRNFTIEVIGERDRGNVHVPAGHAVLYPAGLHIQPAQRAVVGGQVR